MSKRYRLSFGKKIVVVPAHMESSRLPGKPLLETANKPLVQWTYERAKTTNADHVIVATGDMEIARYCQQAGMAWMLTTKDHPNGTSRIAEILDKLKPEVREQVSVVVNWQVDEPMIKTSDANALMAMRIASIGTLVCGAISAEEIENPNLTKVVWSGGKCHWFSRAPMLGAGIHVGLYSFTPFLLRAISMLKPSRLSMLESLEQLTWVENGFTLKPVEIEYIPLAINTPEDWTRFKSLKEI